MPMRSEAKEMADHLEDYSALDQFADKKTNSAATKLQAQQRSKNAKAEVTQAKAKRSAQTAEDREEMAFDIFDRHDADNSKYLSIKEMNYALREMLEANGVKVRPNMDAVEKVFDEADADGNGRVDFEEFKASYNKLVHFASSFKKSEDAQSGSSSRRINTRDAKYKSNEHVQLSADETELMCEIMQHEGKGGGDKAAAKADRFRMQQGQYRLSDGSQESGEELAKASADSLKRVEKLLKTRVPAWPEVAHRQLSNMFMEAVSGNKFGTGVGPKKNDKSKTKKQITDERIDTAKMDQPAFSRFIELLLGKGTAFLVPNLWADAIQGDTDGMLTFQEACKFFSPLNSSDVEVRAAFMFDMYDKDDSGAITLEEISQMITESSPGSLAEQDLLALARFSSDPDGDGKKNAMRRRKKNFVFDDYLYITRQVESNDPNKSVTGYCRYMLGLGK